MYIKSKGNPCPGSLLLEEVPETPLDFWEATEAADAPASSGESNAALATRFPPDSIERKLAILRHHQPTCPRPSPHLGWTVAEGVVGAQHPHVGDRWQAWPTRQLGKMYQALWSRGGLPPVCPIYEGRVGGPCRWTMGCGLAWTPSRSCSGPPVLKDPIGFGIGLCPRGVFPACATGGTPERSEGHLWAADAPGHGSLQPRLAASIARRRAGTSSSATWSSRRKWRRLFRSWASISPPTLTLGGICTRRWASSWRPNRSSRTPLPVWWSSPHDTKSHMRERAICDQRISLPLSAFRESWTRSTPSWLPVWYPRGHGGGQSQLAVVLPGGRWGCGQELLCQAGLLGGGDGIQTEALWQPQSPRFLGKMECGLVLSLVSPWACPQGARKAGGFACKYCDGFWKAKAGSSRVVQLLGRSGQNKLALQLILDDPPEPLYQKWIQDRMEYYPEGWAR